MVSFPLVLYPTISLVLSEDEILHEQLLSLKDEFIKKLEIFHESSTFLEKLKDDERKNLSLEEIFSESEEIERNLYPIEIEFRNLPKIYLDKKVRKQISNVILDCSSTKHQTLDICRKIKEYDVQKILLINSGEEKIALEAFNEGLIDQCIHKNNSTIKSLIKKEISKAQQRYFKNLLYKLEVLLSLREKFTPINDPKFFSTFYSLLEGLNIKEYCLFGLEGYFLLKDNKNREKILLTFSLSEIEALLESKEAEENSSHVLEKINRKKGLAFCLDDFGYKIPEGRYWKDNFHPIYKKIKGKKEEYFLFLVDK